MPSATFERLRAHFEILGLADRYRLSSLIHLREQWKAFARYYGSSRDSMRVAEALMTEARDREEDYGPNYWQAVLCRTLAANREFCDGGFEVLNRIQ